MNQLSIQEILQIIVGECSNGCHDARSTVEYFENKRRYKTAVVNIDEVKVLVQALNFAGIREVQTELYNILHKD